MPSKKTPLPGDTPILALAHGLADAVGRLHGYALGVFEGGDLMWGGPASPMRVACVRPRERFNPDADAIVSGRGTVTQSGDLFNANAEPFVSERREASWVAGDLRTRISAARARFVAAGPPEDLIRSLDALAADALSTEMLDPGVIAPKVLTAKLESLEKSLRSHAAECGKHTSWMEGWAPELSLTKPAPQNGGLSKPTTPAQPPPLPTQKELRDATRRDGSHPIGPTTFRKILAAAVESKGVSATREGDNARRFTPIEVRALIDTAKRIEMRDWALMEESWEQFATPRKAHAPR